MDFSSIKVLVWLKVSQVELIAGKCKNFKRLFFVMVQYGTIIYMIHKKFGG